MKITDLDVHVLLDPNVDVSATSSAQDDLVVEIHTDEGISGIGETDVNPWIGRACIDAPSTHTMGMSLREMLIGQDPLEVDQIWDRLYVNSAMNGRRGAVINAIGAIDIALHDLRGKALEKPCWELLGSAVRDQIVPYASLQPEVDTYDAYRNSIVEWASKAVGLGFRAVKTELTLAGPFAHKGLREPWCRATEILADVRAAIGPEVSLLVDVQYAFESADQALSVLADWVDFDLFFVETPLWPDDLAGHARLAEQSIPIASGEWLTTRFEFQELVDRGCVSVIQPDIGRVGGLTEATRACRVGAEADCIVVPHLWKTGISIAAAAHLATVTPNLAFIEFLPAPLCESGLRRDLTSEEVQMRDGVISPPRRPGLGIDLDRDALRFFAQG